MRQGTSEAMQGKPRKTRRTHEGETRGSARGVVTQLVSQLRAKVAHVECSYMCGERESRRRKLVPLNESVKYFVSKEEPNATRKELSP